MFKGVFEATVKERVKELEENIGRSTCQGFFKQPDSVCKRLDSLEEALYDLEAWKKRVEGQLGVEEITSRDGKKEFLGTTTTPVRGYIYGGPLGVESES